MSQGLSEYRAGSKKNWRGWQWNRIVERLSVPVEEALVLYLCGPDDIDREKALAHGFRNENLIAVDREDENVRRVRVGGGIGICHDLGALVREWPEGWPLDVIVADFCVGFDRYVARFGLDLLKSRAVSTPQFRTVLALNLQRGRDAWSKAVRGVSARALDWHSEHGDGLLVSPKHRGAAWATGFKLGLLRSAGVDDPAAAWWMNKRCAEVATSYRSSSVVMDSVVMRLPCIENREVVRHAGPDTAARRKIAACRAVRTMRARGTK